MNIKETASVVEKFSSPISNKSKSTTILLAAGHGKRIKSNIPKVVHEVWGVPSILRIARAAEKGLKSDNVIMVVGIKADDVARMIGKTKRRAFAYQPVQKGTGHAVQVGVSRLNKNYKGNVYIFPGDAGLIDARTVAEFRKAFEKNGYDMMLLTGIFDGPKGTNYYGRVVRVPRHDIHGQSSNEDFGNVMEIIQYQDILSLKAKQELIIPYRGKKYAFSKQQLIEHGEFDSGMFAFRADKLLKYLFTIKPNNVQGEIYVTDLVNIFNRARLRVGSFPAANSDMLLGFNDKSSWKWMEAIARRTYYEKLKNIIVIEDEERFFIDEDVIEDIITMDKKNGPLDIVVGPDCSISKGVVLNRGVVLGENVKLDGTIILGENVKLESNINISTYPDQVLTIGKGTEIVGRNIIKGNVGIGEHVRIETGVNITGSDEFPTRIGNKCLIKGTSYIFGSIIESEHWIEHSILVKNVVERIHDKEGTIQKIKFVRPVPEGMDSIKSL